MAGLARASPCAKADDGLSLEWSAGGSLRQRALLSRDTPRSSAARCALEHSQPADSDIAEQVALGEPFGCGGNEVVEQDVVLLEFGHRGHTLDAGEVLR